MESTQQCKGGAECVLEPDTQARPVRDDIEKETDDISNENVSKQPTTPVIVSKRQQQYQQYRQRKQPAAIEASESNKLMTEENNFLYGITCTILLFMILNYAKNKYKRRQREMESSNQLEMVRQRNLLANRDMKTAADGLNASSRDARTLPQSPMSKHMSQIRERQQNRLSTSSKLSRQKKTRKKQSLKKYLDMNHTAADEALERRQRVIAAEQTLLQPRRRVVQHQQQRNDIEEAERVALVQQQNADYEEALMLDQARSQQLSLKKEIRLKRKRYRQDAEQRLTIAGVQSRDILTNNQNNNIATGESSVRVRLLLPSGRKVDGVFAATQKLGLVYDLALLVLDKEKLLYSDEDGPVGDFNDDTSDTDDDDQSEGSLSSSGEQDYIVIQQSWQDAFFPFSIVSVYPQRSYQIDATLTNCGLNKAASLMVVVETD